MARTPVFSLARFMAMLAMALQVFLPGAVAVAESKGVDVSRFLCAPSGIMSAQSQATVERLAALLDDESDRQQAPDTHCPLCTLAQSAIPPEPVAAPALAWTPVPCVYVRYEPGFVHQAQGPPLGSRGPPSLV